MNSAFYPTQKNFPLHLVLQGFTDPCVKVRPEGPLTFGVDCCLLLHLCLLPLTQAVLSYSIPPKHLCTISTYWKHPHLLLEDDNRFTIRGLKCYLQEPSEAARVWPFLLADSREPCSRRFGYIADVSNRSFMCQPCPRLRVAKGQYCFLFTSVALEPNTATLSKASLNASKTVPGQEKCEETVMEGDGKGSQSGFRDPTLKTLRTQQGTRSFMPYPPLSHTQRTTI